jgi:5-methyltetrahydrofolate--homocysteine methyltransferase
LNAAFLAMAIASGMTCAITNALDETIRKAILAADVLMGHDENCAAWLAAHREASGAGGGRGRRRERRRESSGGSA